jgi:peptidoglycan/LPS O-acetylase OafA/YrhL
VAAAAPAADAHDRPRRSAPLDALRGVAILLVLGRHVLHAGSLPPDVPLLLRWWFSAGWVGVDLFFVLSGFLIGGALLRELTATGHIRPVRFLARRGFRIYPPFYLLLALTVAVGFGQMNPVTSTRVLAEALFLQDYVPYTAVLWTHTWSLAVEEQFYLVAPFALSLAALLGPRHLLMRRVLFGVGLICLIALGLRLARIATPYADRTHLFPVHLRLDALALGVGAAGLVLAQRDAIRSAVQRHASAIGVVAFGLLTLLTQFPVHHPAVYTIGLSVIAVVAAQLVLLAHFASVHHWTLRPIALIGQASYSIYLFHVGVRMALERAFGIGVATTWPGFIAYAAAAIVVGVAIHYTVERPFLRLRDRWIAPPRAEPPPQQVLAA